MHGQRVVSHGVEEDGNQLSIKFMREETSTNYSNVQHRMSEFGSFSPFMDVMKGRMHIYNNKLHGCPQ